MKLYYKYINLFSPFFNVETIKRSFVAYECVRLENASYVEKKKFVKSANFWHLFLPIAKML